MDPNQPQDNTISKKEHPEWAFLHSKNAKHQELNKEFIGS
tara:strand:- start:281 stop:400 length:120 start_codon:yes stop_codon:yes gene_type:complete